MDMSMVKKLHCRKPLRVVAAISLTWEEASKWMWNELNELIEF